MVSRPSDALLSPAEGELYRCGPAPEAAPGAAAYEDVLGVALRLRAAYDTCRDLNGRLVGIATKVPVR